MSTENRTVFNTVEFDALARDFSYADYELFHKAHTENNMVAGAKVCEETYLMLRAAMRAQLKFDAHGN